MSSWTNVKIIFASTYLFANSKNVPTYISLQTSAEIISGSKTQATFILFHKHYDFRGILSINKDLFLHFVCMMCNVIHFEVCITYLWLFC